MVLTEQVGQVEAPGMDWSGLIPGTPQHLTGHAAATHRPRALKDQRVNCRIHRQWFTKAMCYKKGSPEAGQNITRHTQPPSQPPGPSARVDSQVMQQRLRGREEAAGLDAAWKTSREGHLEDSLQGEVNTAPSLLPALVGQTAAHKGGWVVEHANCGMSTGCQPSPPLTVHQRPSPCVWALLCPHCLLPLTSSPTVKGSLVPAVSLVTQQELFRATGGCILPPVLQASPAALQVLLCTSPTSILWQTGLEW